MKNIILRRTFWQILFLALSAAYLVMGNTDRAAIYLVGVTIIACMDMER